MTMTREQQTLAQDLCARSGWRTAGPGTRCGDSGVPASQPADRRAMPQRGQGPLRAALDRAVLLYRRGNVAEALTGLRRARTGVPHDGSGLPSDEAAALAASWELQAAADLCAGELEAGLEGLAIAEQVLDGRPEHNELRGRLCARIAWQVPDSFAGLRSVRAEYLASARHLLAGSPEYRELPDAPPKDWGRA